MVPSAHSRTTRPSAGVPSCSRKRTRREVRSHAQSPASVMLVKTVPLFASTKQLASFASKTIGRSDVSSSESKSTEICLPSSSRSSHSTRGHFHRAMHAIEPSRRG